MPRRCTNCANVRRQQQLQQQHTYPSCQETGTDPNMGRLCWLTTIGAHCGRSVCKMMRGVTWIAGTLICCMVAWMIYSEFSDCVTNFFWNIIYTFLAIAVCAIILVILSGRDFEIGNQPPKEGENNAEAGNSKRSAYAIQDTSFPGVSQVNSFGGSSGLGKSTTNGRSAGAGESRRLGSAANDTQIRVTEFSSSDDIKDTCDPCPLAEEE